MAWSKSTRISLMLVIDGLFFVLELGVGLLVGSLALMADAFHMLNDIISLVVGLWAVTASQKQSSEKYSFGYLRAEILGAFFNAVFLIALCLSIVLEAITRLIDPPEIDNPTLILIVGSLGLASNLAGFFVLGGHGHSHGSESGHSHGHGHAHGNPARDAEEGHGNGHVLADHTDAGEEGRAGDVFPEALISKAKSTQVSAPNVSTRSGDAQKRSQSGTSTRSKVGRRMSRGHGRIASIDEMSIHPASFRQEVIAISNPRQLDGIDSEVSSLLDEQAVVDGEAPNENSPLLRRSNGGAHYAEGEHSHSHSHGRNENNQLHAEHGHNDLKKSSGGGHGHSHADMGMNAMILHVIGDALGNVGVIISALVIMLTTSPYRFYADPAVSLFITLIILKSTIPLTTASAKILLQATPDHLPISRIKEDIERLAGVVNCHHIHVWQLSDDQNVASLHVILDFPIGEAEGQRYMEMAREAKRCLHEYGVHSVTIQPEYLPNDRKRSCRPPDYAVDGTGSDRSGIDYSCMMGCVEDCKDRQCCSEPSEGGSLHDHSDHDEHGHDHDHEHPT